MLKQLPFKLNINQLLIITGAYFALVLNFPFLSRFINAILALAEYDLLFLASVPIVLCCLLIIIFSIISTKHVVKPVLIMLTLTSSLVFYGSIHYGVVFDYGMMENAVETSRAEAFSYLNVGFTFYFIAFGAIPAYLIYLCPVTYKPFLRELASRLKLLSFSIVTIGIVAFFYYQDYASVGRNNSHLKRFIVPTQFVGSGYKYIKYNYFDEALTFTTLDNTPIDAHPENKEVIILVLGETARAKNFSINGYEKPTNSHTQRYQLTSFKNMFSCGTATAVSVPCLFSSLVRKNFDRKIADNQQNLLDIVSLAGVDVLWIDNNGCKDVCNRIPTVKIDTSQESPLCDGEYCQDGILLDPLQKKLSNLKNNKTIIVLHTMGSHGPTYFKRYPDSHRKFLPDCPRSDIQNCTSEALTNTYDNTINYTDYVLSQIIGKLETLPNNTRKTMIYVSDHGESLGESGAYLHGFPYALAPKEQRHIPMLLWMPQNNGIGCLNQLANTENYSHDNIYHSVLGLLDITSTTYQKKLDIFSLCPR